MRFTPASARAIIAGRKTTHRIPARAGDDAAHGRYRPGSDHAVCPGGAPSIGRIVITRVDRCALGTITDAQVAAEGYADLVAFVRAWLTAHDSAYRPALEHATDEEALDRFRTRHAGRETWVLSFVVDPTAPVRLLAARSEDGYVTHRYRALPDEPEAVDAAYQAALTASANRRDEDRNHMTATETRRRLNRDITDLQQRLMAARRIAQTHPNKTIQEALRLADAQLRRAASDIADNNTDD